MRRLDRYILADLVRMTCIVTGILVVVIAFGAAIKPLSEGALLSFGQTAKYVVLVSVPMLQFALPFAAGLAGTVSLHRRTTDNEILAAAAAGVSYRRLLVPPAVLGIALLILMTVLTQWVIPRFWTMLERTVTVDVVRLFEASIRRGDAFALNDRQIFARTVRVIDDPDESEADTRLILFHVTAISTDTRGVVEQDITARQAAIDVYRRPNATLMKLAMADAIAYDPKGGGFGGAEKLVSRTIAIPTSRASDTQQWTFGELLGLRHDPDQFASIAQEREDLLRLQRIDRAEQALTERLAREGAITFTDRRHPERTYDVMADTVAAGAVRRADGGSVEIVQRIDEAPAIRFLAETVTLEITDTVDEGPLVFDLVLENCTVTDLAAPDASNRHRELALENLATDDPTRDLLDATSAELIALERASRDVPRGEATRLDEHLDRLQVEIIGRLSMRLAVSITAPLLLMLGCVLAMWRRESAPLTIYIWAFVPAIADLLLMASGEDLMRNGELLNGQLVMWSGNAVLLAVLVFAYRQLRRR